MFWEAAFESDFGSNTTFHKPSHKQKACNEAKRHILINPVRKSIISSHASKLLHRFSSALALELFAIAEQLQAAGSFYLQTQTLTPNF
jgi:hypothetical protein